jgi:hypothetical protein
MKTTLDATRAFRIWVTLTVLYPAFVWQCKTKCGVACRLVSLFGFPNRHNFRAAGIVDARDDCPDTLCCRPKRIIE